MRLTGLEPTRRIDTSTSSWPVYQFQHSRKHVPSKKDCLIIIAIPRHNVNRKLPVFEKIFIMLFSASFHAFSLRFSCFLRFFRQVSAKCRRLPKKHPPFQCPEPAMPPAQICASTSPMGSVITSPAARSRATADLLISASRLPR